ncbi:MAG: hypothetical protein KJ645_01060 [Planctomycetes bacterium]|nr:hypothetical protein [Planctomycetota bacterium]
MTADRSEQSFRRTLIIGTRGSDLALWQTRHIQGCLQRIGIESKYRIIKTQGDRISDLAVHSFKDLATEMPEGLCIAAMVGREDSSELLLANREAVDEKRLRDGELLPLRPGAQVGTSAARR